MKAVISIVLLLTALFIASCGGGSIEKSDYKSFDSRLQGTWASNDPSVYSGGLVIGFNSIKITGYYENQKDLTKPDELPFKYFTKDAVLEGYSEEGKIFIKDKGVIQEGILFTFYTDKDGKKHLKFTFGERPEILDFN